MAKKGLFRSKGPLIYATIVSLICVMSASISTFAWFQAEARVRIETSSDSATVTVQTPDPLAAAFFVYKGNGGTIGGTSSSGAPGYPKYWEKEITSFGDDFQQIVAESPTNGAAGLTPGRRLTYCIKISGDNGAAISGSHSAYITGVTDAGGRNRYLYDDAQNPKATETLVKLGWAINIYATCIMTASNAVPSASDIQTYIRAAGTDKFLDSPSGANHSDAIATASGTDKHFYFFYTIELSNTSDTYFQHVDNEGNPQTNSPASDSENTYWSNTTSGDSEVYSGLTFNITEISIV